LNHSEQDETFLAVALPPVLADHGKRVTERNAAASTLTP
jgi:hypothetical protein